MLLCTLSAYISLKAASWTGRMLPVQHANHLYWLEDIAPCHTLRPLRKVLAWHQGNIDVECAR